MAAKLAHTLHSHRSSRISEDRLAELLPDSLLPALPTPPKFIGRQAETQQAIALWQRLRPRNAPKVMAIVGQAGVGKSALALHLAHQLKSNFSDAVYLNLRSDPPSPTVVTQQILNALAIENLSALLDRRILLLLDHLEDPALLQPLLALGTNCTILITSRQALPETAAIELQPMSSSDGIALLQAIAPAKPIQAEANTARAIVQLCDGLPLPLRLVAGLLQQPQLQLLACLQLLTEERNRCEQAQLSYPAIRASFNLSYRQLDARSARLLRLLGLLAEPSFTLETATALSETAIEITQASLANLLKLRLLESSDNRYRLPDLLRRLVKGQLAIEESTEARQAARLRLAQTYQRTAEIIGSSFGIGRDALDRSRHAQSWFELDRPNLLAAIDWTIQAEAWQIALPLIASLSPFQLRDDGTNWQAILRTAISAAEKQSDPLQASALRNHLGNLFAQQGDWENAEAQYQHSLKLLRDRQEPVRESQTLANLGIVYLEQGNLEAAAAQWAAALERLPAGSAVDRAMSHWMYSTHNALFQKAGLLVERPAASNFLGAIGGIFKRLIS